MEHEIIDHRDLEKGKCYDRAELYRQETRGEKTVLFTNTPTRYIGQYVGNSWDHTTGPIPPERIYYFRDRDGRTNSLTRNFHDPWLYFREVPCLSLSLLDGNTNIKKIPSLKNLALNEILNNPDTLTSHLKYLPTGNNLDPDVDYSENSGNEPLFGSEEWRLHLRRNGSNGSYIQPSKPQPQRSLEPPKGGKKYIKKSRKSRKIRKSKKIRKSRKSRKSKY
jgi:hypothetical protein